MNKKGTPLIAFLEEVMRRRRRLPSQMAADLGISHATVSRWLSGKDVPSPRSCLSLAEYSGESIDRVLAKAGHIPGKPVKSPAEWPEFREYAQQKYPKELDDDLITMIEDVIERRRAKRYEKRKGRLGK
jgi:transcriptional regulator with XRE-family HTH domain